MPRPLAAFISSHVLRSNLAVIRSHTGSRFLWAVVKANGYGHGLLRTMRALSSADGLALVEPGYALQLREAGWSGPLMLIEGCFDADDIELALEQSFQIVVHSEQQLAQLEARAARGGRHALLVPLTVHLKINSGMNRLGIAPDRVAAVYRRLRGCPLVDEIVLMTHFANADQPDNQALSMAQQYQQFQEAVTGIPGQWNLANSAVSLTLANNGIKTDAVRPGIALYGAAPSGSGADRLGLTGAMTLRTALLSVQSVQAGDAVGYGSLYVAQQPMRVGVVACGYADGYPRTAPAGTPVLVDGVRCPLIGRVSMDMLTIDVSAVPGACIGSEVTLWGPALPVDEVARSCGTIGYELLTALTARVPVLDDPAEQ